VDGRAEHAGNADARRGLWLVLAGAALMPLTVALVAVSPQAARSWIFLLGLAGSAAVSIWGGLAARRALSLGTDRTVSSFVVSTVGFVVGVTAAMLAFWSLVGLTL
jgi:hypothetical protein